MRTATAERKTFETEIFVSLDIEGTGVKNISTGIRFFDHMLEQFASHGHFNLEIKADSKDKDPHHIVEDTALCLGEVFRKALGDKKGINRYGYAVIPMDESLSLVSVDISGRAFCGFNVLIAEERVSDFETILLRHFFSSFASSALLTLHVKLLDGEDSHHKIESIFKAFAKAMSIACDINKNYSDELPSTKGVI